MPQDRDSGAKASQFGHQNATKIIAQLGGTNRKRGSNEFDLNGQRVSVHSAHYRNGRIQSVGVTLNCLRTIKAVLGAFQEKDGSYRLLKLPAELFKKFSRPTASRGPSADRVVLVKRKIFEDRGKFVTVLLSS
jgi:hypothetical protein